MKHCKKYIALVLLMSTLLMLTGCSWVTHKNNLISFQNYEANLLIEMFGEDAREHIESNKLTEDEYSAIQVYRKSTEYLLQEHVNMTVKSFNKISDTQYNIKYTDKDESYILTITITESGYDYTDSIE